MLARIWPPFSASWSWLVPFSTIVVPATNSLAATRNWAALLTMMLEPEARANRPLLPALKSNSPEPSRVKAPAVTVVSVILPMKTEDSLLVVSPTVRIAPLLMVIVALLPTWTIEETWLLAEMVRVAAAGLLLVLSMRMPAASVLKTSTPVRFTVPESMVMAPVRFS